MRIRRFLLVLFVGAGVILLFFFILFFFERGEEETPVPEFSFPGESTDRVASFLYTYDQKEGYLPETSEGWQNKTFTRHIFDVAQDNSLQDCLYFVYDVKRSETRVAGLRECNKPLSLSVGEDGLCVSQGENVCLLYVYARTTDGMTGEVDIGEYSIDYKAPEVTDFLVKEKDSPILILPGEEVLFEVNVTDNEAVAGCWLYQDGKSVGSMELTCQEEGRCLAQKTFAPPQDQESHEFFVQCADHYDTERQEYLNIGRGVSGEVVVQKNHPPEILSCRVTPTQGTRDTVFSFEVQAQDPDQEQLSYVWEFGDGAVSQEQNPQHSFLSEGTYAPKVLVQDGAGEKKECFTAWVIVQ